MTQIRFWNTDAPASPFAAALSRKFDSIKAWGQNAGGPIPGRAPGEAPILPEMNSSTWASTTKFQKPVPQAPAPALPFEAMGKPSLNLKKAYVSSQIDPYPGARGEETPGDLGNQVDPNFEKGLRPGQNTTWNVKPSSVRLMGNLDSSVVVAPPVVNKRDLLVAQESDQDSQRRHLLPIPRSGQF